MQKRVLRFEYELKQVLLSLKSYWFRVTISEKREISFLFLISELFVSFYLSFLFLLLSSWIESEIKHQDEHQNILLLPLDRIFFLRESHYLLIRMIQVSPMYHHPIN